MVGMSVFLVAFAVGAALVGFWIALRFPTFGPSRFETALISMAAGGVGIFLVPTGIETVLSWGLPYGRLLASFGVGFSAFVFLFLSGAWFIRLIQDSLQGFMR